MFSPTWINRMSNSNQTWINRMSKSEQKWSVQWVALFALMTIAGCGNASVYDIQGTISFGTEALTEGTVTFEHSESMETYQCAIKPNGSYQARLPPGKYKIFIEPLMVDESGVSDAGKVYKKEKNIPTVYRSSHSTPLSETIEGNKTMDFNLKK
jgi:hypothetical protein